MKSPCDNCPQGKVENRSGCPSGKMCDRYRMWFIETWDTNRLIVLRLLTEKEKKNDTNKSV